MGSARRRMQKYRKVIRASGLKLIQIWVPDIRCRGFAKECRRQSRLIQQDPQEWEILKMIASISEDKDWA